MYTERFVQVNFIFDIGNVLISFRPELFLHELFDNPAEADRIDTLIFKSNEWVELDAGLISSEDACLNFCTKAPESKELIMKTMEMVPDMLTPLYKTIQVLPEIKKSGHKLYYLSNYHKKLSRHIQDKYAFFELFDGGVFSCDVHMLKPSVGIYQYLLDKYGLNPYECVFFDDTETNVLAAQELGIKGVLFTDVKQIMDCIECASV